MRILVIGSGAREDAICKSLLKNKDNLIYCAPGNDGIRIHNIKTVDISENDFKSLSEFAKKELIDFTIVGPEEPLVNGIVDYFQKKSLDIFGPTKMGAKIEGSKSFTKKLMADANIPTAEYHEFSDLQNAIKYLNEEASFPIVIKADGLAAGKGVYIVKDLQDGLSKINNLLSERKFNTQKIVIEEFLSGEEFSLMAFVDNENYYPMPIAQDYKKIFEDDKGPNTGGMGAVCPVKNISEDIQKDALKTVIEPFIKELIKKNIKYTGIIYAGLILTKSGIKVIEFNARFGDPETEVVLPRLRSDLSTVIQALINHKKLNHLEWDDQGLNLGVFAVSKGYPNDPQSGDLGKVSDFEKSSLPINYASVKQNNQNLYSAGGRLYLVQAKAPTLKQAQDVIYNQLEKMKQDNIFYRRDIGKNSL